MDSMDPDRIFRYDYIEPVEVSFNFNFKRGLIFSALFFYGFPLFLLLVEGLALGFERLKLRYQVETTVEAVLIASYGALAFWSWLAVGLGILGMIWMYFSDAPVVADSRVHLPNLRTNFKSANGFFGLVHPKYAFFFGMFWVGLSEFLVAIVIWFIQNFLL